jgi:hypothetical protein
MAGSGDEITAPFCTHGGGDSAQVESSRQEARAEPRDSMQSVAVTVWTSFADCAKQPRALARPRQEGNSPQLQPAKCPDPGKARFFYNVPSSKFG